MNRESHNGTTPPDSAILAREALNPIPSGARLHCVITFSTAEQVIGRFLEALPERAGELGPQTHGLSWTVVHQPRSCTFSDLALGQWRFRVVFDLDGVPPSIWQGVTAGQPSQETLDALEQHRAACLVFLIEAPPKISPWDLFKGFCSVVWAWVDAGATVVAFPEGQVAIVRRILLGLEPEDLQPEHAYLFLSNGVAKILDEKGERKIWLRTWGLGQFLLPDLAIGLPAPPDGSLASDELESLRLLFETLPPSMVAQHGILPVGGTVQVGTRVWTAVGPPGPGELTFMTSRCGFQLLV